MEEEIDPRTNTSSLSDTIGTAPGIDRKREKPKNFKYEINFVISSLRLLDIPANSLLFSAANNVWHLLKILSHYSL